MSRGETRWTRFIPLPEKVVVARLFHLPASDLCTTKVRSSFQVSYHKKKWQLIKTRALRSIAARLSPQVNEKGLAENSNNVKDPKPSVRPSRPRLAAMQCRACALWRTVFIRGYSSGAQPDDFPFFLLCTYFVY